MLTCSCFKLLRLLEIILNKAALIGLLIFLQIKLEKRGRQSESVNLSDSGWKSSGRLKPRIAAGILEQCGMIKGKTISFYVSISYLSDDMSLVVTNLYHNAVVNVFQHQP